jgi:molybdate transport system substrate-binding protein
MNNRARICLLVMALLSSVVSGAAVPVRILATQGVQGAITDVQPLFKARAGTEVTVEFGMAATLLARVTQGENPEIVILPQQAVQQLAAKGKVRTQADLGSSTVGVAVADDAPLPVLKTPEDFAAFLKATPSIAYTARGASGVHIAKVIQQLGLADIVKRKATVIDEGLAATLIREGKVAAAVQQITELKLAGAKHIVPLPDALQLRTVFTAAVLESATSGTGESAMKVLTSPEAAAIYERSGLTIMPK